MNSMNKATTYAPFAQAKLPTRFGDFEVYAFVDNGREHIALVHGNISGSVNVRIHSKCLTGDTFASLRCDCRDQLERSLNYISKNGGILIYLDQEGRGIGLANKIKAYSLQDKGSDTVEANNQLGFDDDLRDYGAAATILKSLGVTTVALLTNNPDKTKSLESHGIAVSRRIPLVVKANPHNKGYIETKKSKMNHLI